MGALLAGLILNAILYGLLCLQSYQFFNNFGKGDRLYLRTLVSFLWILDTFQLVLNCHAVFHYLISNYDRPDALQISIWSINIETGISTTIIFLVRGFFAARVWQLSNRSKVLASITVILSLAQLGLGYSLTVLCFVIKRFDKLPDYVVPVSIQSAISVLTDMTISAPLIYYLMKSKTGRKRTNSVINVLLMWAVNTALITGINELLQLITWVTMSTNLVFIIFHLVTAKLYTNSMLAMLNGRSKVREELGQPVTHTSVFVAAENRDVEQDPSRSRLTREFLTTAQDAVSVHRA
ncbi:hypothetical protein DENSPDRAFT_831794 [Dentipellis sp. KUC8613]|nr:hypothetical protein DENSPDRAFT_831794 [Dentipellis sp. KUC8613]